MKKIIQKLSSLSKYEKFGCISVVVILIWMSIGWFPLVNFESDSTHYIVGCNILCSEGYSVPPRYIYEWNMQPLSSILICGLHNLIPVFSCEAAYCILSIVCTLIFIFFTIKLATKLTDIKWFECIWLMIMLPEVIAISYYGNTAIPAAACFVSALYFAYNKPLNVCTIILFGIAPLFRLDILCVYPVILFLMLNKIPLKKSITYSVVYAISTVVICGIGCYLFNADPFEIIAHREELKSIEKPLSLKLTYIAIIHLAFYTLGSFLLIVFGSYSLAKLRKWTLLAFSLSGVILLYYIHFPFTGCGTKHIMYIIPFWVIIMSSAKEYVIQIYQNHRTITYLVLLIVLAQFFISIKIIPSSKPWIGKEYANLKSYPYVDFAECDYKRNTFSVGLGAGCVIPTNDEYMLATGNFFLPFYWSHLKSLKQQCHYDLEDVISTKYETDTVRIVGTNGDILIALEYAVTNGYTLDIKSRKQFCLTKESNPTIICYKVHSLTKNPEEYNNVFDRFPHPLYFFATTSDPELYYINEGLTKAKPVNRSLSYVK